MIRAANAPFALTATTLWRAASVSVGGLFFGFFAAPSLPVAPWLSAPALAAAFAVLFIGGAGHPILHAVARRDAKLFRPANWSDGVTATACVALAASAAMLVADLDPARLMLGLGFGLSSAYVPAKIGCIEAGCCAAGRHRHRLDPGIDLRLFEIGASVAGLALAASVLAGGSIAEAAAAALGGHLAVRLHSRLVRGHSGSLAEDVPPIGREVVPLIFSITLSIGIALAG